MTRSVVVAGLFGAAVVSGVIFLTVTEATVVPMVARGTGADGVQVTIGGWVAWGLSILSTSGFTTAGLITFLAGRFGGQIRQPSSKSLSAEVVELTASFLALMNDRANRAVQRRFFFALVDAANLIQGCETSHEAGVVTIRYQGYADPVTPFQQGGAA
ncbi:hypothetical protein [Schlesneria paludicola]|uniref:hypothetical protein n=1 Tax=Schlesneria paludicola TaxID=360056 RepID=UPI00029A691C|nr:hypothetical protein [Schlesneria paludicola]